MIHHHERHLRHRDDDDDHAGEGEADDGVARHAREGGRGAAEARMANPVGDASPHRPFSQPRESRIAEMMMPTSE